MSKCPNLPRKFFDYLAAGLPVVVNVEGDMSKLVEDNWVGLVCGERDAKGLANNLIRLYLQRELKEEMAGNTTRIIAEYDLDKIAKNFEKEFKVTCFESKN
jgi:glycosyltransferase involved in cell wall biosynthesis